MNTTTKQVEKLKTIDLDGYKIHYMDMGKGEPVVFVHGAISDYRVWEAQMEPFSEKHRVIALSRRYAWPNDQTLKATNDYSVRAHAKDLAVILKKLDIGAEHLVGHSYGGFISLVTSLEHPDLIKSLTLMEPPVGAMLANIPEAAELNAAWVNNVVIPASKAFADNNDEKGVALFVNGVMGNSDYFENAPQTERSMWLANTHEPKAVTSGADLFPPLGCEDVRKNKVPTLLIKGEESPKDLRLISDELHKCIQNSELQELPNASHGMQHQNPEGFNKLVMNFINKHL